MKMKLMMTLAGALLLAVAPAEATLTYGSPTVVSTVIPDGNLSGVASSITVSGADVNIVRDVNVTLQISGGFNGDLYGYLLGPDGAMAVLLNRIGRTDSSPFGSSTSGMTITLDDTGGTDIHNNPSGSPLTGTWASDGRLTSPFTVTTSTTPTAGLDQVFAEANNHPVNGTWTLFLADVSGGDISSLVTWGLNITVVPEPATWALLAFAAMLTTIAMTRQLRVRRAV